MRVVVVGAGLGGLSAACHLRGRGHEVTVVEREDIPGGRAGQWASAGYRIDTGPSVLTMPGLLAETFAAAGADIAEHLRLAPLDPMYRAWWPDAEPLSVRPGREAMTEEIRQSCGSADAAAFGRFADWLARLYRVEQPQFVERNYDRTTDLLRPLRPALELVRLGAWRKMAAVVDSYFADPRLRQLFSFQALYAGLSPFDALAIYCVITYMDVVGGVWFPEGGIHSVSAGLADAATKAGADIRYCSPVERIVRRLGSSGPVVGVRLAGGELVRADAVVANPDVPAVYRELLPSARMPRAARRGEYSPSATLWLAGVRGSLPEGTGHHNIHFGGDWKGSFEALLRTGTRQPDPAILVSVPTLTDASLAPEGGQVVYALEPVPNLDGRIDWASDRARFRDTLVERLEGAGYPVGAAAVVTERFVDPLDWEAQGMERGTPFALSHRFSQTGPWRPANRDRRVPGLVLVGSGTVPGVSVPMVLVSGRLAADRVDEIAAGR
ncbi:MAG: phytoene desaturase family protein [Actinomycetota bacterium]|nr:phytoene desaturase family protein [Actinomycetota bacterium]